jgi:hypothetical protein
MVMPCFSIIWTAFGKGDRNAEHPALAVRGDAHSNQHGTIDQVSAFAHPFIAGVEENRSL